MAAAFVILYNYTFVHLVFTRRPSNRAVAASVARDLLHQPMIKAVGFRFDFNHRRYFSCDAGHIDSDAVNSG